MNIGSSTPAQQLAPLKDCFSINEVPTLVAKQFRVDIEAVTSETHFANDLGADLYQTAETLTHLCHRRVREPRPYGPPNVLAMNVPMGRSQHESGSASFGITRSR
jgi:hypothetical protein